MIKPRPKLSSSIVFIGGPTASGKTAAAITLAQRVGGEIICADSRTVYRGLDIGTAKPSAEERAAVRHWLLDVADPGEHFSAHKFKQLAQAAIIDIQSRGVVPIVVGGTGLYLDSLIFDMELVAASDHAEYSELSIDELHALLDKKGLAIPENSKNKRHLIAALRRNGRVGARRDTPIPGAIVVAIDTDAVELRQRIRDRAEVLFADSRLYDEAREAANIYGWDAPGLSGNIYRLIRAMDAGELSRQEALEQFVMLDWHLAKRQKTWLRRSDFYRWVARDQAVQAVMDQLSRSGAS